MKKIFSFCTTIIICSVFCLANAQPPEGRQFDPTLLKERQKTKLKDELKLTDAQADSVVTVQMEFVVKKRGLRSLPQEERMAKMKEINDAQKARLTVALKDEKLVDKIMAFEEKQRMERMQRMQKGD